MGMYTYNHSKYVTLISPTYVHTIGSNSPPTKALTPPSFRDTFLTVELSLSATNIKPSVGDRVKPEGWANPALVG